MGLAVGDPYTSAACLGFSSTDQSLDPQYFIAIDLPGVFSFSDFTTLDRISHRLLCSTQKFQLKSLQNRQSGSHLIKYRYLPEVW